MSIVSLRGRDAAGLLDQAIWVSWRTRALEITLLDDEHSGDQLDCLLEPVAEDALAKELGRTFRSRAERHRSIRHFLKNRRRSEYEDWLRLQEPTDRRLLSDLREVQHWPRHPAFSIVMPCWNSDSDNLRAAVSSVVNQAYPNWELIMVDDCSTDTEAVSVMKAIAQSDMRIRLIARESNGGISRATNTGIETARHGFIVFMDHDDLITPDALLCIAQELNYHPEAKMVFSNHDGIDKDGRFYSPMLKPGLDRIGLLARNAVTHINCVDRDTLQEVGGLREGFEGSQDHDLVLRLVSHLSAARIRHIPRVLYHWRRFEGSASFSEHHEDATTAARRRTVEDHLRRHGLHGEVVTGPLGLNSVRLHPKTRGKISIIIPSRNGYDLIRSCVDSIQARTRYENFEIVIVDNGSDDSRVFELYESYRRNGVRILIYDKPFNFAAICNFGVDAVSADYVLLLNNDTEVIQGDWLERLLAFAEIDHVGAVGCRLLFPDRTIQHAGIVLDSHGLATHVYAGLPEDAPGAEGDIQVTRKADAVTGACLLVDRTKYLDVGGMDAENFAFTFNDIDLCLKLDSRGFDTIYVGNVSLIHKESATRGNSKRKEYSAEADAFWRRWEARLLGAMPFYLR